VAQRCAPEEADGQEETFKLASNMLHTVPLTHTMSEPRSAAQCINWSSRDLNGGVLHLQMLCFRHIPEAIRNPQPSATASRPRHMFVQHLRILCLSNHTFSEPRSAAQCSGVAPSPSLALTSAPAPSAAAAAAASSCAAAACSGDGACSQVTKSISTKEGGGIVFRCVADRLRRLRRRPLCAAAASSGDVACGQAVDMTKEQRTRLCFDAHASPT